LHSKLPTDGYGTPQHPFVMPDPVLSCGWDILRRERNEDGEHIWYLQDPNGHRCRWLEDEDGLEWAYRVRLPDKIAAMSF
jgi:hypothetical protein